MYNLPNYECMAELLLNFQIGRTPYLNNHTTERLNCIKRIKMGDTILMVNHCDYEYEDRIKDGSIYMTGIYEKGKKNRKHILVVEDNQINREIATTVLKLSGFLVTSAVNGQEAVNLFEKSPVETFDGILMDIQMPVLNGYEATKKIRKSEHPNAKDIMIVACTANNLKEDKEKAFSCGMNVFLEKPVSPEVLKKVF